MNPDRHEDRPALDHASASGGRGGQRRRLEEAFAKATRLPDDEQDAGARWLMDEFESERHW